MGNPLVDMQIAKRQTNLYLVRGQGMASDLRPAAPLASQQLHQTKAQPSAHLGEHSSTGVMSASDPWAQKSATLAALEASASLEEQAGRQNRQC